MLHSSLFQGLCFIVSPEQAWGVSQPQRLTMSQECDLMWLSKANAIIYYSNYNVHVGGGDYAHTILYSVKLTPLLQRSGSRAREEMGTGSIPLEKVARIESGLGTMASRNGVNCCSQASEGSSQSRGQSRIHKGQFQRGRFWLKILIILCQLKLFENGTQPPYTGRATCP